MWNSWKRFWSVDDLGSRGVRLVFKDMFEGLRLNGKEVHTFPLDPTESDYKDRFRRDLLEFEPDVVILANFPSAFYLREFGIENYSFQCIVWLLDDPEIMGDQEFDEHEIVLVADPQFERGARERGARRIFFLPVAAPDRVTAEYKPELEAPLAYVGSIYIPQEIRKSIRPEQIPWLTTLIHKKVEYPSRSFNELSDGVLGQGELSRQIQYFLYCEANRIYRYRYLNVLAPLGLRLYGNALWKTESRGTALESCFCGRLESFTDYPNLIRSVRININLRSLQGFDAPTHRDFLVPRLGGFLLSSAVRVHPVDWKQIDLHRIFRLDEFPWSPQKHSPLHLYETAQYYLEHDTERREWIDAASREIAEYHTYARRMEQLGKLLDAEEKGFEKEG